jgi:hypothetical protein
MNETTASLEPSVDQQVLDLRRGGRSFALIARRLDLPNAIDAQDRFMRSMVSSPEEIREQIRAEELQRLEGLAEDIRTRSNVPEYDRSRLLLSVARLRDVVRRS